MNRELQLRRTSRIGLLLWLLFFSSQVRGQFQVDLDKSPFNYLETEADNRVSRLVAKLESKELELRYTREHGYLRSLLAALDISESSQTLVFSKTSMQVQHISRKNPRAIYFNDDTYVGWINGSPLIEVSTADPKLGTAFYTFEMSPRKPAIKRAGYDCLGCHATSLTQGVPGHVVRSIFPTYDGNISVQKEAFVTGHTSPFAKRWGDWFVTGQHGEMQHMGNSYVRGEQLDTLKNGNRSDLNLEFNTNHYLSPYSDIVALMVLEHQTQMHNTLTRTEFSIRHLMHERSKQEATAEEDRELQVHVRTLAKSVVDCLLFSNEFQLTSDVSGIEDFVLQFANRGPKDSQGRSLRDFDLKTRMFKYPCSYLIYSDEFDSLEPLLRSEIYRQLLQVLSSENRSDDYKYLDESTRDNILAILVETKSGLPEEWKRVQAIRN